MGRDRRAALIAAEAWGIVTAAELRAAGFTANAIATRERNGTLHRLHRAVYAVGHPNPPWEGSLLAAVRACGPAAVLSHYSAAELWGVVDRLERLPDVTVVGSGTRSHRGIRVHRTRRMAAEDRCVRTPRRRGSARLRAAIRRGAAPTNSDKESDVLDLIVEGGFALPDVNKPLILAGRRVVPDLRRPEARLIVEIDSDAWHADPLARADDAARQRGTGSSRLAVGTRRSIAGRAP